MIKTICFYDRKNFYLLCLLVVYNGSFVVKSLCLRYVTHVFTYTYDTLFHTDLHCSNGWHQNDIINAAIGEADIGMNAKEGRKEEADIGDMAIVIGGGHHLRGRGSNASRQSLV